MANELIPADLNPLNNFSLGSNFGSILLIVGIVFIVMVIVVICIWFFTVKRAFWIKIHVFRLVGNNPTRVAIFRAREVNFGLAGDKLWRVAPTNFLAMPFKIIKWLPVGRFQTSNSEFWYWIRGDGEWINFTPTDIDNKSQEMKVKFVQEDMRLQRLATERILEQRLLNKNFWEKYGVVIGYVVFFLVITVSIIIIFYQWGKLIEKMNPLVSMLTNALDKSKCSADSLVPAIFIPYGVLKRWIRKI